MTASDDQAIGLTRLTFPTSLVSELTCATMVIPNAHTSAVTAIACLDREGKTSNNDEEVTAVYKFASTGNDQRLKTWSIAIDSSKDGFGTARLKKVSDVHSTVADASALEAFVERKGRQRIVVVGVGMESWSVSTYS